MNIGGISRNMKSCVSLQSIIVALCLGHVLSRGFEEQKIVSFDLEVISPWHECLKQLGNNNNNNKRCDVDLFKTEDVPLANKYDRKYLIEIQIGSDRQKIKVQVDTGSDVLWVFGPKCEDPIGNCKDHTKFNIAKSQTCETENKNFVLPYSTLEVKGLIVEDTVFFSDKLISKSQKFGIASYVSGDLLNADGILGLDMRNTWGLGPVTSAIKNAGMEPIFSLFLNRNEKSPNGGEITFGGVNKAHLKEATKLKVDVIGDRMFYVQMDQIKFGDNVLCPREKDEFCVALIDSGSSVIVGPPKVIDPFVKNILQGTGDKMFKKVDCQKIPSFPPMEINFGKEVLKLEAEYYIEKAHDGCFTKLYGIKRDGDFWILGVPFLQKYYSEYNMAKEPSITFYEAK